MNDVIFGRRAVLEAFQSKVAINKLIIARGLPESEGIGDIISSALKAGVEVVEDDRRRMDRLAQGGVHQGVIAFVPEFSYADFDALVAPESVRLIVLDGVTDPQNLGSILRSADAFGWSGLLVPRHRAVGVTPAVRKVASGAAERVPVCRTGSAAEVVKRLQTENVTVVGLDPGAADDYRSIDYTQPRIGLVLGAEGGGIKRLVRNRCDHVVRIPMTGAMASLNVAIAAAVVMVEVTRSRELDDGTND